MYYVYVYVGAAGGIIPEGVIHDRKIDPVSFRVPRLASKQYVGVSR